MTSNYVCIASSSPCIAAKLNSERIDGVSNSQTIQLKKGKKKQTKLLAKYSPRKVLKIQRQLDVTKKANTNKSWI